MTMRTLETIILNEARALFHNRKLRLKDIREWRTSLIFARDGEVVAKTRTAYVAILREHDKRPHVKP
jgi:hypothetical protein